MFRYFAAVLLFTSAFANEYYKGDALVREGVYAFYNYEFDLFNINYTSYFYDE